MHEKPIKYSNTDERKEKTMKELMKKYGTSGNVTINGSSFPVLDIPMMTDERWQQLARENAVSNYKRENGKDPESVELALEWQRQKILGKRPEQEGQMRLVCNFPLKEIVISEDFKKTKPAAAKLDRVRQYVADFGNLPDKIVINENNVLIDGYCTYLVACELAIDSANVRIGYVEVIEASHKRGGALFLWKVPDKLIGKIRSGDRCIVRTKKGAQIVTVENVVRQQYPVQHPRMKNVIRIA